MTNEEKKLILSAATQKISKKEFFKKFPIDLMDGRDHSTRYLEEAIENQDGDGLDCRLMLLGILGGGVEDHVPILCRLIKEKWHERHEDLATIFQDLADPRTVDVLFETSQTYFDYLDYNDSFALHVKCAYALGAIGNEKARNKLEILAKNDNKDVREAALYNLKKYFPDLTPLSRN